ncbi:MAG: DUF3224 domain-containing protein [Pseudonocardia sp.]|nr:DUF3224 domain-containing protein [Pseudonocardia sp.]
MTTTGRFDLTRWDEEGSAAYVGIGVDVVPDSGTGELRGLRGEMTILRAADGEHTYSFVYELD